jgi:hypothetical protein
MVTASVLQLACGPPARQAVIECLRSEDMVLVPMNGFIAESAQLPKLTAAEVRP